MSYAAVHAHPDGEATVARFALTAADRGFDGVVVRNHGDAAADYDAARIADEYGVDVVDGVEVRAEDPSRASGYVGSHRAERTVVCVHGGTERLNRFAVEQPAVDVLAHPTADGGGFDHVMAKAAADNGVRVEVSLAPVLRADGGRRVKAIRALSRLRTLVEHYDVPYVVSADPTSHLHLRSPRELAAVGEVVGFDAEAIERGLDEWGRLAERNRERRSDAFVEPGVWRRPPGKGAREREWADAGATDAADGTDTTNAPDGTDRSDDTAATNDGSTDDTAATGDDGER